MDHAGGDRKVEDATVRFDANVSRQVSEAKAGEPWPEQASQQDNRPDSDQNPLHVGYRTAHLSGKEAIVEYGTTVG
jgi:hypothetical protein